MGILQGVGWALTIGGLAMCVYIASTGKWVRLPGPLGAKNIPVTERGRRLSGLAGIVFFIALAIEESFVPQQVSRWVALSIFLGVFALILASVVLQAIAWRIKR